VKQKIEAAKASGLGEIATFPERYSIKREGGKWKFTLPQGYRWELGDLGWNLIKPDNTEVSLEQDLAKLMGVELYNMSDMLGIVSRDLADYMFEKQIKGCGAQPDGPDSYFYEPEEHYRARCVEIGLKPPAKLFPQSSQPPVVAPTQQEEKASLSEDDEGPVSLPPGRRGQSDASDGAFNRNRRLSSVDLGPPAREQKFSSDQRFAKLNADDEKKLQEFFEQIKKGNIDVVPHPGNPNLLMFTRTGLLVGEQKKIKEMTEYALVMTKVLGDDALIWAHAKPSFSLFSLQCLQLREGEIAPNSENIAKVSREIMQDIKLALFDKPILLVGQRSRVHDTLALRLAHIIETSEGDPWIVMAAIQVALDCGVGNEKKLKEFTQAIPSREGLKSYDGPRKDVLEFADRMGRVEFDARGRLIKPIVAVPHERNPGFFRVYFDSGDETRDLEDAEKFKEGLQELFGMGAQNFGIQSDSSIGRMQLYTNVGQGRDPERPYNASFTLSGPQLRNIEQAYEITIAQINNPQANYGGDGYGGRYGPESEEPLLPPVQQWGGQFHQVLAPVAEHGAGPSNVLASNWGAGFHSNSQGGGHRSVGVDPQPGARNVQQHQQQKTHN
jgi:hypothetical protein